MLRDKVGLTGTKEGCATGDCGACTVVMDGNIVCSCLVYAAETAGHEIETVEGVAKDQKLHPVQQKLLEHAGLQCGICTPGVVVAAKALLERNPRPERARHPILAVRQPVPLHRLRQDRARGAGRRLGAAGAELTRTVPGRWRASKYPPACWRRTGGESSIEVEAHNVRGVLRVLDERFPGLVDELKATTAIAIDGEIIGQRLEDAFLERVQADSEVYFIPAVAGG